MLIQFSAKKTEVLSVGQAEENEAFAQEVKFMCRHVKASQFVFFSDTETEWQDIVVKLP
jgi:hypothetical protein